MRTTLVLVVLGSATVTTADSTTPFHRSENSCSTVQEPLAATSTIAKSVALAPGQQRIVYLNRFGGKYNIMAGATDSSTNVANTRITRDGRAREAVIRALPVTFDWPMIVSCVKEKYKAINVRFVETEPTTGPYLEAVVGGDGSEVGSPAGAGLLGVASADNFCNVTETGIAFNFAEAHGSGSRASAELCITIAHEVGHLLALEHETLANDVMSYVPVSQAPMKAFVDQFAACGLTPNQPMNCSCPAQQQNSFQKLTTYVGPKPVEAELPSLTVESPDNGDTVAPVFEVVAKASDNMAMADVRVLVDGAEGGATATNTGGTYKIRVNAMLGDHQLTVIARDEAGNESMQTIAVKVAKSTIGETCVANESCEGNLCATAEDGNFCTQTCDVNNDTCPSDFECAAVGGSSVCVEAGGCGCEANDPREGLGFALTLGFGAFLLGRRPCRRRAKAARR